MHLCGLNEETYFIAKILSWQEQLIQTVKGQKTFWEQNAFLTKLSDF